MELKEAVNKIHCGDALAILKQIPDESVHCCVTSPPYFNLRNYFVDGQIGLEDTPAAYVVRLVEVFREVQRVLRQDGVFWCNIGDSYNGSGKAGNNPEYQARHTAFGKPLAEGYHGMPTKVKGLKPTDVIGVPWMLAFALRDDGWYLRQEIIWSKLNCMPESVDSRCTKSHEQIFLLAKSAKYFYDAQAIAEPCVTGGGGGPRAFRGQGQVRGDPANREDRDMKTVGTYSTRNKRSVWTVATKSFADAHFATFNEDLITPMILAGTSEKGCCSVCGAPYIRQVQKITHFEGGSGKAGRTAEDANASGKWAGQQYGTNIKLGPVTDIKTTGWLAGCACGAPVVPCVVLDPFMGSGTTALVSRKLGRHYIGIDLNPDYCAMARRRLDAGTTLEVSVVPKAKAEPLTGGLFDED